MNGIRSRMMGMFGGGDGQGEDDDEYMRLWKQSQAMNRGVEQTPQTQTAAHEAMHTSPQDEHESILDKIKKRLLKPDAMNIPDGGAGDNGEFKAGQAAGSLIKMLLGGI